MLSRHSLGSFAAVSFALAIAAGCGGKADTSRPAFVAASGPARVMIVRHGEKPDTGPDLNERGYQRANALPDFFKTNPALTQYGPPAAVYAAAPAKPGGSRRSIETCTPTAQALGLTVNQSYTSDDTQAAASNVLADGQLAGKAALFCWEHNAIPDLAKALGSTDAPDSWEDDVYDRVWVIDYQDGQAIDFKNLPQHLLPGDSDT
jgi:hypothetical protein